MVQESNKRIKIDINHIFKVFMMFISLVFLEIQIIYNELTNLNNSINYENLSFV